VPTICEGVGKRGVLQREDIPLSVDHPAVSDYKRVDKGRKGESRRSGGPEGEEDTRPPMEANRNSEPGTVGAKKKWTMKHKQKTT